jgi:hypothetical protein
MPSIIALPAEDLLLDDDLPPIMPSIIKDNGAHVKLEHLANTKTDFSKHKFSAYSMDCWAAGVCMYCFMYGNLPFPIFDVSGVMEALSIVKNYEPSFDIKTREFDKNLLDIVGLIKKLLVKEIQSRFTVLQACKYADECFGAPSSEASSNDL